MPKPWMMDTRKPNASYPLHVSIGPGAFASEGAQLSINCNPTDGYTGYTTFTGSGSSHTVINGTHNSKKGALLVQNCTDLNFSDLKLTTGNLYGGVYWLGGGNSRWTNVTFDTKANAWYEDPLTCGATRGKHYWFSSKLNVIPDQGAAFTYFANCDESWFFGSEVKATISGTGVADPRGVVYAKNQGIVHLYGSNLVSMANIVSGVPAAAMAENGGQVHIHGTGIDVIDTAGNDIIALKVASNGSIHANASAYNLQSTGTITRLSNTGGSISAPYQWKQNNQPPVIVSEHGADTAVVTDTADGQPHPVIYSTSCVSNWFDTITGLCY